MRRDDLIPIASGGSVGVGGGRGVSRLAAKAEGEKQRSATIPTKGGKIERLSRAGYGSEESDSHSRIGFDFSCNNLSSRRERRSGSGTSEGLGSGLLRLLRSLLDAPVEDVVVLESFSNEQISEEFAEVRVVGLVVEAERSAVVEIDGELVGEASTEVLRRGGHLLLHDAVVLLLLRRRLESLPGERATEEVHEDVAERFHVVSSRLLCRQNCQQSSCVERERRTHRLRDVC